LFYNSRYFYSSDPPPTTVGGSFLVRWIPGVATSNWHSLEYISSLFYLKVDIKIPDRGEFIAIRTEFVRLGYLWSIH